MDFYSTVITCDRQTDRQKDGVSGDDIRQEANKFG